MTRVLLRLQDDQHGGLLLSFEQVPGNVPEARLPGIFKCHPDDESFRRLAEHPLAADAVRAAGERLFSLLVERAAAGQAMGLVITRAAAADPCPLYIDVTASRTAKALPWELLWNPQQQRFMALDRRWQVCRRVVPMFARALPDQPLASALRLFAVLAATGNDAAPEWQALLGAIRTLEAGGLEIAVRVALCQPELKAQIEADLGDRVRCVMVSGTGQVQGEIASFRPQLLHFFCHGSVAHGAQLHLATRADFVADHPRGSVAFGPEEFEDLASLSEPAWLVTLNACQTGDAGGTHRALTEWLAETGFPAVIGMREEVVTDDAHLFTEELYKSLFGQLATLATQPPGSAVELDFTTLLLDPRQRLVERHADGQALTTAAGSLKQWSLPVIYVRPEPLRLRIPAAAAGGDDDRVRLRTQLETLMGLRATLAAEMGTPAAVIERIDQRIQELIVEVAA